MNQDVQFVKDTSDGDQAVWTSTFTVYTSEKAGSNH